MSESAPHDPWIACHDCDLLLRPVETPEGGALRCPRCGATLVRRTPDSVERSFAFALAAAILWLVSNAFPFLGFQAGGQEVETTLISGVWRLWQDGAQPLAVLVLWTAVLAPAAQILLLLAVLSPLYFGRRVPWLVQTMRLIEPVGQWSMMEVFLIGIFVALVKLVDLADIIPGIAIYSFVALIPVLAATLSSLDPHEIWGRIEAGT